MSGALTGLTVPSQPSFGEVQIAEPAAALPAPVVGQFGRGRIRIELPSGVRLTVDASVDADALSRVISVLARCSCFPL